MVSKNRTEIPTPILVLVLLVAVPLGSFIVCAAVGWPIWVPTVIIILTGVILIFCGAYTFSQAGVNSRRRKVRIGTLPENPVGSAIYRRNNGDTYVRINERFHVKAKLKGNSWVGDGIAEEINLDEKVEVLI